MQEPNRPKATPVQERAHGPTAQALSLRSTMSLLYTSVAGLTLNSVAKHATAAGVREDRRTAHVLRHTFCTMLAERGVALEVIRALAGHIDIRTTQIYVDVADQRKADGIAALERISHIRCRRAHELGADLHLILCASRWVARRVVLSCGRVVKRRR